MTDIYSIAITIHTEPGATIAADHDAELVRAIVSDALDGEEFMGEVEIGKITKIDPGGQMTPAALRELADWLDMYDRMAARYLGVLEAVGKASPDDIAEGLSIIQSKEIQEDLRRWATELD